MESKTVLSGNKFPPMAASYHLMPGSVVMSDSFFCSTKQNITVSELNTGGLFDFMIT